MVEELVILDAAAILITLVLLHASYRDLSKATIHDWHWLAVTGIAFGVALWQGELYTAAFSFAVFGVVGLLLMVTGRWGSGDFLMLAAIGAAVNQWPYSYAYSFLIVALLYLTVWKVVLGQKARFMPVFAITYIITYLGQTGPF